MTRIIGIHGLKYHGKDTVGKYLRERHGARLHSHALPFKKALSDMFGVPLECFEDPVLKETPHPLLFGHTPRHMMQTIGTEWGRTYVHEAVWALLLRRRIREEIEAGTPIIAITDVRSGDNEAIAILELGGEVWAVDASRRLGARVDMHTSEDGVSSHLTTHTLDNNGTIDALYAQVAALLR